MTVASFIWILNNPLLGTTQFSERLNIEKNHNHKKNETLVTLVLVFLGFFFIIIFFYSIILSLCFRFADPGYVFVPGSTKASLSKGTALLRLLEGFEKL